MPQFPPLQQRPGRGGKARPLPQVGTAELARGNGPWLPFFPGHGGPETRVCCQPMGATGQACGHRTGGCSAGTFPEANVGGGLESNVLEAGTGCTRGDTALGVYAPEGRAVGDPLSSFSQAAVPTMGTFGVKTKQESPWQATYFTLTKPLPFHHFLPSLFPLLFQKSFLFTSVCTCTCV